LGGKKLKILVTGAGGPAGVGTIKALMHSYSVVAVDSNNLAPGLYLANQAYVVPNADDPTFIPKILKICRKNNVSLVIPTVSEELLPFSQNIGLFQKKGVTVAVSGPESIEVANNKLKTYGFFKGESFCPEVYSAQEPKFPCVVKPIESRGSRGFYICENMEDLKVALEKNVHSGYQSVVMELLKGVEFSVYGLSDLGGKPLVCVINKRIRAVGESKVAKIVLSLEIEDLAFEMARKLKLVGPWNIQLMGRKGFFKLVEVNPRVAGSLSLVEASGLHYIDLMIKIFTDKKIQPYELQYHPGIIMTRYNEELFLNPDAVLPVA
jgi:carbamoyl-phosphate synthase large subunit